MRRSAIVLVPLLVTACATVPPTRTELPVGRAVEAHHVSRLAPAETVTAILAQRAAVPAADPDGAFVLVECAQYLVAGGRLAKSGTGGDARILSRAELQPLLEAGVAAGSMQRSARPSLRVRDGATASMSTTHDQAFVAGFDIARAGAGLVGDPRIETTREGTALEVRARIEQSGSIAVDVRLERTEIVRPLTETDVRVPGSAMDVVVQMPLALQQRIESSTTLASDEVLVLSGIHEGEHDVLFVVGARRDASTSNALAAR